MTVPSWAQTVCLPTSQCNPLLWPGRLPAALALLFPTLSCSALQRALKSQAFTHLLNLSLLSSKSHKELLPSRKFGLINVSIVPQHDSFLADKLESHVLSVSIICTGLGEEEYIFSLVWRQICLPDNNWFGCKQRLLVCSVHTADGSRTTSQPTNHLCS